MLVWYWDHRHLNDMPQFTPGHPDYQGNASAENIARIIFQVIQSNFWQIGQYLHSVTVKETDKTAARYEL